MKLETRLSEQGPNTTLSELYVEGVFECYILEDQSRLSEGMILNEIKKAKVYAATAIAPGHYFITLTWSPRFKKVLPLLNGVVGFAGIRIHPGNTHLNTEGCLLPGKRAFVGADKNHVVSDSRKAFNPLYEKLKAAADRGEVIELNHRI